MQWDNRKIGNIAIIKCLYNVNTYSTVVCIAFALCNKTADCKLKFIILTRTRDLLVSFTFSIQNI